jgi:hypothetical protein
MPRTIEVDQAALTRAVSLADKYSKNEGDLWRESASLYNADHENISPQTVAARVKLWNIPYSTEKGRKPREVPTTTVGDSFEDATRRLQGVIYAPAGEPCKKLKDITEDAILEWMNAVRDSFLPRHLATEGLLYYINHYFCSKLEGREQYLYIQEIIRKLDGHPLDNSQ